MTEKEQEFTENGSEETEEAEPSDNETELNDEGVPRPAPDPKNGIYTFLSLLIFAVLYFGKNYIVSNFFTPYSMTAFDFEPNMTEILEAEACTPLPEGGEISMARLSSGTDNGLLHIWYSGIGSTEDFPESFGFSCGDPLTEQRVPVFTDESFNVTYVYADIYVSSDDPNLSCYIYEYEGESIAEFRRSKFDPSVRTVFKNSPKIKDEAAAEIIQHKR